MRHIWQYYLDLPIFGKITMMLAFCLSGYIILGIYNATVIKKIEKQLDRINIVQGRMVRMSHTIEFHANSIRDKLNALTAPDITKLRRKILINGIKNNFQQLDEIISTIEKGRLKGAGTGAYRVGLPKPDDGSRLWICMKNATHEIKSGIKFLTQYADHENSRGQTEQRDRHISELKNELPVIEKFSSCLLFNAADYIKKDIKAIKRDADRHLTVGILVMTLIMLLLIIASYTWGTFLVGPLRLMARSLKSIKSSAANSDGCSAVENIPIIGNDEIAEVAYATNRLIQHMRNTCHFRRTIESDETAADIYHRLGQVFKRELNLKSFVIYETRGNEEKMLPVYVEPPEMKQELAELNIGCKKCRARRTGSFITSFKDEGICPVFSWPDALTHACIPMNVGGEILGVIQFLFPFVDNPEREEAFKNAVMEAKFYLMEALPVLKAKLLAQTLAESATRDPMTGLFNRRYLELHLSSLVARTKRTKTSLGILMCDLDYFKQVNDRYGHDTGDMVLIQLAKIIKEHARESDLAIRFGGEEFLILLVDCDPGFAEQVAERIRSAVEKYIFHFPGGEFSKTISVGISEFPQDTDLIWEAIKFADVALYHAKDRGRNRVKRFKPAMWDKNSF